MLIITGYGPFLIMATVIIFLLFKRKFRELFLVIITVLAALESAYLLKKVFLVPRPSMAEVYDIAYLTYSNGFSFPSQHAAFSFSLIPLVFYIFKPLWVRIPFVIFLISIAFSRIYLAVHFVDDVVAGGILGLLLALAILQIEKKFLLFEKCMFRFLTNLEFRRQFAHLVTGLSIIVLVKLNLLNAFGLLVILVFGAMASLLSMKYHIPIVHELLKYFERPNQIRKFPGKGSFYLVLGAFFSLLLFERQIALAAIAIVAVGDSFTAIVGAYFGQFRNPFNPDKNIEGTVFAIFVSTLAAFTFVDFNLALLGATGGMLFESVTKGHINRIVDDNLFIPLVSGFIMSVL
jgi:dolichol kinase